MAKSMPKAGRAKKASATKPVPVKKGMLSGSNRQRASLDVPWNPLGVVNGPVDSGKGNTGRAPAKRPKAS